jgi:hypothetical protein
MKILLSHLSVFPVGRIVLHVLCAVLSHHWAWHWRGVLRELCPVET